MMINWDKIDNKTILITGSTGLIGKTLIERILDRNISEGTTTKIIAVGRSKDKFVSRYRNIDVSSVTFLQHNVINKFDLSDHIDYIVHLASNTHPKLYASDPINTVMANVLGTYNLLELASKNKDCKFFFMSSGDIYGDNVDNKEFLSEDDCGYINCNTLRAGYIEGKRASEALCNAYYEEKKVEYFIGRLCRVFGSNMQLDESKAISQFILNAASGKDIELKSEGNQIFSYLSAEDAVDAMLYIMCNGKVSEAYNISDNNSIMSLKDLATLIAKIGNVSLKYGIADELEKKGASSFKNICLNYDKISKLGWKPSRTIDEGIKETIIKMKETILKNQEEIDYE